MGLPLPTILVTVPPDPHTAACMGMPQILSLSSYSKFLAPHRKKNSKHAYAKSIMAGFSFKLGRKLRVQEMLMGYSQDMFMGVQDMFMGYKEY